jgi:DNA-binding CsgD family transcriptional regulator/tetratricopeptide (TPR) repeat protein
VLVGRGPECAAIDALLDDARRSQSGSLVLRGEPGVGKTALLSYAVEHAPDMFVLAATGTPSESSLPFAGLHQLLRPMLDHLDAIPDVQATALRGALGLAPTPAPDRFLIALAALSLVSELSEHRPLLCVLDDVQWLDSESLDALRFVARRLDAEGVSMIFATDATPEAASIGELPQRTIVGLDRVASDALLIERTGQTPAPHVRAYLWESTRGNPLALIELSTVLNEEQLAGREPLPDDLRLGVALQDTLLARVNRLPEPTRTVLLLAAAEGTGDVGLVLRAGERMDVEATALEPAELAGLVRVDDAGLVFLEPLMRTAIYQGAPFGRRQAAHRALADCLTSEADADRRTWHRAAAAIGPDDEVAGELERSAARARVRGGHAAAAAALERAADLASERSRAARYLTEGAADAWMAGRAQRTRVLLDRAAPLDPEPEVAADAEYLRGLIESTSGDRRVAFTILLEGSEPMLSLDPERAARMLGEAGRVAWSDADLPGMIEAGRRMESLDLEQGTPVALAVNVMIGMGRLLQGDSATAAPLIRASVSRADLGDPQQLQIAGAASMFIGDDRSARSLLSRALARGRALGTLSRLPQTLATLSSLEMWEGNFSRATTYASEGVELARETEQEHLVAHFLAVLAWIAAAQGRIEACIAQAAEAIELATAHRTRPPIAIATWALALSDIGQARWSDATVRLEVIVRPQSDAFHPMVALLASSDLVEAARRLDRLDQARSTLARFEVFARSTTAPWPLALVARCRALLADGPSATAFFDEALERHAKGSRPFDEGRTRLLYGEHLRRTRRRTDARDQLRRAIHTFERMGARPWEERARAELRATGETARKREASTIADLTPQQAQIVRLVSEGATNKEVAAQLFLSPRTVDYHLRNVFAKLGIASRAELIRLPELDEIMPTTP